MILNGAGGANTQSGKYFEQITHGEAPGIPLHKKELSKYYKNNTGKYLSLSLMHPGKNNGIPKDKMERAEKCKGQYLLSKSLEPDEAYLDYESSTLTIFEKKFQGCEGSVDEKLQTAPFKLQQYKQIANDLGIKTVNFIFILGEWFKSPYYTDMLNYIKNTPGCDYFFAT